MGKMKRTRQKLHLAAKKAKPNETEKVEIVDMEQKPATSMAEALQDNTLFRGLNIDGDALRQKLPDFDARSSITSKSLRGLHVKKKEKQKLKHELWMKKLSVIDAAKKEAKAKKKRQQTPVVGDIGALGEALPTLELLLKGSQHKTSTNKESDQKPRGIQKEKKRKKQMMSDMSLFQQVLDHPSFQENPTSTIHEHLQNKLRQESDMDT